MCFKLQCTHIFVFKLLFKKFMLAMEQAVSAAHFNVVVGSRVCLAAAEKQNISTISSAHWFKRFTTGYKCKVLGCGRALRALMSISHERGWSGSCELGLITHCISASIIPLMLSLVMAIVLEWVVQQSYMSVKFRCPCNLRDHYTAGIRPTLSSIHSSVYLL